MAGDYLSTIHEPLKDTDLPKYVFKLLGRYNDAHPNARIYTVYDLAIKSVPQMREIIQNRKNAMGQIERFLQNRDLYIGMHDLPPPAVGVDSQGKLEGSLQDVYGRFPDIDTAIEHNETLVVSKDQQKMDELRFMVTDSGIKGALESMSRSYLHGYSTVDITITATDQHEFGTFIFVSRMEITRFLQYLLDSVQQADAPLEFYVSRQGLTTQMRAVLVCSLKGKKTLTVWAPTLENPSV